METRPPTLTRILIAVGFALSCFGLALFLWLAFGGPVPLKPEGYRIEIPLKEASQLEQESDVRISGVSVGKVKRIDLDDRGRASATIELEPEYAPVPADTRAMLRQKTLLGETYVELTPGDDTVAGLPEGDALPAAQVAPSVQLDEIYRTFDDRTRAAFQEWMQGAAGALDGRGEDLSVALASLDGFARETDQALRILDSESVATSELVASAGEVFGALSERPGQLSGLIRNTERVFATTARRDRDLQDLFRVLPTFERESRMTLHRLDRFAADTNPVLTSLRPGLRELAPAVESSAHLSSQLTRFWPGLDRAIDKAPRGFSALRGLIDDDLPPLLRRLPSFFDELTPILTVLRKYRHQVTALLGNLTAATNASNDEGAGIRNYVRTLSTFSPEMLAAYPQRLTSNRWNGYRRPKGYRDLSNGLESFSVESCSNGIDAVLDESAASDPAFNSRTDGDVAEAQDLLDRIKEYAFVGRAESSDLPQPACVEQAPYGSIGGAYQEFSEYLHVRALR